MRAGLGWCWRRVRCLGPVADAISALVPAWVDTAGDIVQDALQDAIDKACDN